MSRAEGTWGEAEVANYLRRRGYTLLAHGFHCRFEMCIRDSSWSP